MSVTNTMFCEWLNKCPEKFKLNKVEVYDEANGEYILTYSFEVSSEEEGLVISGTTSGDEWVEADRNLLF